MLENVSGALGAIDHNFVEPRGLTQTAASSLSGWIVSCALVGCILGALVAGACAKRYGRKPAMLLSGVLFAVGSVGSAYPELGFAPVGAMGVDALLPFMQCARNTPKRRPTGCTNQSHSRTCLGPQRAARL